MLDNSYWEKIFRNSVIFGSMIVGFISASSASVDLSNMPDQLPDMVAGQTVELDVSGVVARGGLKSVRWDLNTPIASRKFELDIIGDNIFNRDGRYWYFKAPSLPEDKVLTFDFLASAEAKDENAKRYQAKKTISVLVKAGKGEVIADVENQTNLKVGDSVSLDATGSKSGNGEIVKYVWRQTEGPLLEIDVSSPVLKFKMPSFNNANIGTYANDLKPGLPTSIPDNVIIPNGIKNHFDFKYKGAFRVDAKAGDAGKISFSPGVIGVNPENTSIFVTGTNGTVAEMKIPDKFGFSENTNSLPVADVVQNYFKLQDKTTVGKVKYYVINGLLIFNNSLILTCENWYDTKGNPWNMQFASNAYDLANSKYKGFLKLEGKSRSAGFMSEIPDDLKAEFGNPYMSGWGSNYSIDGRYSIGPTLYSFNPKDVVSDDVESDDLVPSQMHLSYSLENMISKGANIRSTEPNDPIWGVLASAHFGFIVPNTRKYIVFGRHAGLEGGVGYKIAQEDGGNGSGSAGEATYLKEDTYPYFWIFEVDDILNAENEFDPKPISYGKFMVPYAIGDVSYVKGGSWNTASNTLYLSISGALQHRYIRAPIILAFEVSAKTEQSEEPKIPKRVGFDLEVFDSMGYSDKTSVSAYLANEALHTKSTKAD